MWDEAELIARSISSTGRTKKIGTDRFPLGPNGVHGNLYIRKPASESSPEWIGFVREGLADPHSLDKLKNKSVSALLVIEVNARQFVLAFGHGRHMLEPRCIEDRFGIRVVLNSISPDKIASIDKQTFDASPRISRTQAIKATSMSDYEVNAEQDLLRALVGLTKTAYKDKLGSVLAGMDSLKTSVNIELKDLRDFLESALERSQSKDYLASDATGKASEFAWVDNLQSVSDKVLIGELEKQLWKEFSAGNFSTMWLAIPEIIEWVDVTGFAYSKNELDDDSDLDTHLEISKLKGLLRSNATLETLKNKSIFMKMASGIPPKIFSAIKCIYAEITHKAKLFILHAGNWYHVEPSFLASVQDYFSNLPKERFSSPFIEYAHAGEGEYNEAVAKAGPTTHAMLDRRLIQYGGKHGKIEVCDLYSPNTTGGQNGKFIHVKRGRSSSTLSHLFSQGLVSASLLVREPDFVAEVNKQLARLNFSPLPTRYSASGSTIVYAIIDGPANNSLDIPFFSKVNLQHCGKSIAAYGFSVSILSIPESAQYLSIKAIKKHAKKSNAGKTAKTAAKPIRPSRGANHAPAKP